MTTPFGRVGETASELVVAYREVLPEVSTFQFLAYAPTHGAPARLGSSGGGHLRSALADSTLSPDDIAEQMLCHGRRHGVSRVLTVTSAELTRSWMHRELGTIGNDEVLAFTSRVTLRNRRVAHVPLMDFACERSDRHLDLLRSALPRIVQGPGALLDSGRSYHFYGAELLSPPAWRRFLAQAVLLAPLTDVRYVAHRLMDGECVLRLTSNRLKPVEPRVLAVV